VRFVDDALAAGGATLVPEDQEAALATLARLVRGRSDAAVVAVVGSTGKTTTKDALGALCGAVTPTVAAYASKNNELGLPLTVLRLEPETRVLVAEMGMRGLGQIAELCEVARPTVALVTSIGPEHLEVVGTVEQSPGRTRRRSRRCRRGGSPSSRPTSRSSSRISATTSTFAASTAAPSSEMAKRGCSPSVSARSGSSCRSRSGISRATWSAR
jgi:hypothetical protein